MPSEATWIEPENNILSEACHKNEEKHRIISLTSEI